MDTKGHNGRAAAVAHERDDQAARERALATPRAQADPALAEWLASLYGAPAAPKTEERT